MIDFLVRFSLKHKAFILFATFILAIVGIYSLLQLSIGAVPDVTNNQVQVITTSRNLSTQDVEQFITYPVELEMANLPGVSEIRSVSKFGLSVVTVVFDDDLGTYLPRQLIAEKLKSAAEQIPEGFGNPEMGPISTGLGEIYQYILDVMPGYEDRYSVMELRTIQDWVVKRQLSGIPGVIEVNTWGGYLKQFEVSVNPQKLKAYDITISEIFTALEQNNSIAGGGYIEKNDKAYFIRAEGLAASIDDISKIVVKPGEKRSVLVSDVAEVQLGKTPRFGAITANGEGEKVMGQIMMLKGAPSKEVIEAVKERVASVQNSLPEGVYINPILERGALVDRTTFTITENLVLGCLIVIFVVVLLLGNWRSGLVVASVIPLALLFALTLMNLFGIDANLMSLGAIDFGIIIDGAVIIVEYIAFKITQNQQSIMNFTAEERKQKVDEVTEAATIKMMHPAIFGQLIIFIVFIPVLSLSGIEGKMFKPMALTFSFALLGAMILCFTYVPVISSYLLGGKNTGTHPKTQAFIALLHRYFEPSLRFALAKTKLVFAAAIVLFISALSLFLTMGGEFVPTLDEGDFVIQPVLPTGTSLSKTIEITTRMEQVLRDKFPDEVLQTVSRIGAAEVPTDPMSMEEIDLIIALKPRGEWTVGSSKDELADAFSEALSVIPEVEEVEFTQPIEMRFNELITGVRADVAIKLFGEDLSILAEKAEEISHIIQNVDGAEDIVVEKIEGLPQVLVQLKRDRIARYGLTVAEVNNVIRMSFSGGVAGQVFEGEKRFDLVVRLEESQKMELSAVQNLLIPTPSGLQIPLHEVAKIEITEGPAKISRDDTYRRVVVGVNVRNRDLASVVKDVQNLLEEKLALPSGYYLTYGGQFENLENAKARLSIAVPVALFLILLMLYFAFQNIIDAVMVFSAIPLASVGGVVFLWLRDMPFSISAGIGFIALFGIAVLNGLVLIEHFKELEKEGITDIDERVIKGTKERLRPVLLTASAAALGFLPMAISTSAGAEVQRPLATVVIGGLITATLLTLMVLPVLYAWVQKRGFMAMKNKEKLVKTLLILLAFWGINSTTVKAQDVAEQIRALQQKAVQNHPQLMKANALAEAASVDVGSVSLLGGTQTYFLYDEANLARNNRALQTFGIQQQINNPVKLISDKKLLKKRAEIENSYRNLTKQQVERYVAELWVLAVYQNHKYRLIKEMDSFYTQFAIAERRRYEAGNGVLLAKLKADAKLASIKTLRKNAEEAVNNTAELLQITLNTTEPINLELDELPKLKKADFAVDQAIWAIDIAKKEWELSQNERKNASLEWMPSLDLELFQASNPHPNNAIYQGVRLGLQFPLWLSAYKANVNVAKKMQVAGKAHFDWVQQRAQTQQIALEQELAKLANRIQDFEKQGQLLNQQIFIEAKKSYDAGQIGYIEYLQSMDEIRQLENQHLDDLLNYNLSLIAQTYFQL